MVIQFRRPGHMRSIQNTDQDPYRCFGTFRNVVVLKNKQQIFYKGYIHFLTFVLPDKFDCPRYSEDQENTSSRAIQPPKWSSSSSLMWCLLLPLPLSAGVSSHRQGHSPVRQTGFRSQMPIGRLGGGWRKPVPLFEKHFQDLPIYCRDFLK